MPELPEVEAVVRALREDGLEGARLRIAHILRPSICRPQSARQLESLTSGVAVLTVARRAKHILIHLANGYTLHIHLRMTGDLAIKRASQEPFRAARAEWELTGRRKLVFTDERALGRVHAHPTDHLLHVLEKLGPEPLSPEFTKQVFAEAALRSRLPAKLFLMDQKKVAGLGNIYAAEALFRARLSPFRPIAGLSTRELERLRVSIQDTLSCAVHSVYKAYRSPVGYRQHHDDSERFVYGREGGACVRCGNSIGKAKQGGRSTYFCAYCQR